MSNLERDETEAHRAESRRGFLKNVGKAALAAPPAVSMIIAATSKPADAAPPYGVPPFSLPPGPPDWR